jgi:EpsD family peptidyl-prolyl cis-trans isomerase
VLERLIDQEVALQKAQEQKLDRDPRVLQELEAARRDIIARAYLAKVGDAVAKPTAEEIKAYYDSKPALFRERRIYTMQELQVDGDKAQIAGLQDALSKSKSLQEVADYLKAQKLQTRATQNTTPAENVPLPLLDRFAALKDGQTVFSATPTGARLVTLMQARSAPISEEQARPAIEQYLVNDRKRKAVEQDLKTIRSSAHVEYVGQFVPKAGAAASQPAGEVAPVAPAAAAAPATAASGIDAEAMNKGLAGLK